jgi:hypothetical protein
VLDFSVAENIFLADPNRVAHYGLMDHGEMDRQATALIDRFSIMCTGPDAPCSRSRAATNNGSSWPASCRTTRVLVAAADPLLTSAPSSTSPSRSAPPHGGVGVLPISTELAFSTSPTASS